MLMSSRIPCDLLERSDGAPVPGLLNVVEAGRDGMVNGEDATRDRSLNLVSRVFRDAQSRQIELPLATITTLSPDPATSAGFDNALPIEQDRRPPGSRGLTTASTLSKSAELSAACSSAATVALNNKKLHEMPMMAPKHEVNAAVTEVTMTTLGEVSKVVSKLSEFTRAPLPDAVKVTGVRTRQEAREHQQALAVSILGGVAGRLKPSSMRAVISPSEINRLGRTMTEPTALPVINAIQGTTSKVFDSVGASRPNTAIEAAVMSAQPNVLRSTGSWFPEDMDHRSNPIIVLSRQAASLSLPLPNHEAAYRRDSQQQTAQLAVQSSSGRVQDSMPLQSDRVMSSMTSASIAAGRDHGNTSTVAPHLVNLTGAVNLDGRRLGRLTASSQAREATLPSRGPSRVNLRAVPVYSGMRIPS